MVSPWLVGFYTPFHAKYERSRRYTIGRSQSSNVKKCIVTTLVFFFFFCGKKCWECWILKDAYTKRALRHLVQDIGDYRTTWIRSRIYEAKRNSSRWLDILEKEQLHNLRLTYMGTTHWHIFFFSSCEKEQIHKQMNELNLASRNQRIIDIVEDAREERTCLWRSDALQEWVVWLIKTSVVISVKIISSPFLSIRTWCYIRSRVRRVSPIVRQREWRWPLLNFCRRTCLC